MIAAGDFDAEENAAPADASTNDKSDQPTEEVVVKEDDKYTKEDTPRRIFVKHIDRKKNPDDIEDYFFDTYKDTGLEDVYTCTVYNARSQR